MYEALMVEQQRGWHPSAGSIRQDIDDTTVVRGDQLGDQLSDRLIAELRDTQASAWQGCLFALEDPGVDRSFAGADRNELDHDCWIEYVPRWLSGADLVFAELVAKLDWQQRQVVMYDRIVAEPRLTALCGADRVASPPLPVLSEIGAALNDRYGDQFDSIGFNYYRDGGDSVAWHGDTVRHHRRQATIAITSVGAPRPFLLRPAGGGASRGFALGQGDLLVMGGGCQHHWQHCVPKVKAVAGPRISITFRHGEAPPRHRGTS